MQHLENLRQALHLLNSARGLAVESKTYQWTVKPAMTFFLQAEHADVKLARHDKSQVLAKVELRAGFGWQMAAEQDEAGIYMVAKRKPLIGSIGRGKFDVTLPGGIHVTLKLEQCQLCFNSLNASLDFRPHTF